MNPADQRSPLRLVPGTSPITRIRRFATRASYPARFAIMSLLIALAGITVACTSDDRPEVVVYTSVDQNFAEPVLQDFERETGIRMRAVYDVEAAKTTGLVNRLRAEADRPRADVWWNGEFAQTVALAEEGLLEAYASPNAADLPAGFRDASDRWAAFGGRARVWILNRDVMPGNWSPGPLEDLFDGPVPAEQTAVALPLFGTTATHVAALYATRGPDATQDLFAAMRDAGVAFVDGNGAVRDLVVDGRMAFGLTDTDDACGALARDPDGPLEVHLLDADGEGTLVVPNTVAMVSGAPHPDQAHAFIDWLLRPETTARLVRDGWFQVAVRDMAEAPPSPCVDLANLRVLDVDLASVAARMPEALADMGRMFLE